jgi:hypothetical protein
MNYIEQGFWWTLGFMLAILVASIATYLACVLTALFCRIATALFVGYERKRS